MMIPFSVVLDLNKGCYLRDDENTVTWYSLSFQNSSHIFFFTSCLCFSLRKEKIITY